MSRAFPYPSIRVPDVVLAMGDLARYAIEQMRAQGELTVVGITGSAGKTTTKRSAGRHLHPRGSHGRSGGFLQQRGGCAADGFPRGRIHPLPGH